MDLKKRKPIIAITMGDPCGVGPEIVLKMLAKKGLYRQCRPVVFGDWAFLRKVQQTVFKRASASRVRLTPLAFNEKTGFNPPSSGDRNTAYVVDFKNVPLKRFRWGEASAWGGKASGDYIYHSARAALNNKVDAVVTAPINKVSFKRGGWGKAAVGHTEFLAHLTGTKKYALMLAWGKIRAVHATSHIPLRDVAKALTKKRIVETITLAHENLKRLGVKRPRLAVCGLNPHASDGGLFGNEEKTKISPAVRFCRRRGMRVDGPLPADTAWPKAAAGLYDAVIAMYHDQGQIPIKLFSFKPSQEKGLFQTEGVNITLGLPIIRTSVDHGTAYDMAGKGIASEKSLGQAIRLAIAIVKGREK